MGKDHDQVPSIMGSGLWFGMRDAGYGRINRNSTTGRSFIVRMLCHGIPSNSFRVLLLGFVGMSVAVSWHIQNPTEAYTARPISIE